MDKLLLELLETLEEIGRTHEEIYDTVCRDAMGDAVFHRFVKPAVGYELPADYGLESDEANERVRIALARFVQLVGELADKSGLTNFHVRLAAFQNRAVRTAREKCSFEDFFGWSNPACFDEAGNVVDISASRRSPAEGRRIFFRALNQSAIYVLLALFFGLCSFSHFMARLKLEALGRQFPATDIKALRAMALIDWVAAHGWLALAYICVVIAAVAFLQIRRRPPWTYWLTAVFFCIPAFACWFPCALIAGKVLR